MALARLQQHLTWQSRPRGMLEGYQADMYKVREIIDKARKEGRRQLTLLESLEIFKAYGIRTAPARMVSNADEAAEAAAKIGYPVVLKLVSEKLVHKTEVGGVAVDIRREEELREAYAGMTKGREALIEGVLVQKMVKGGRETIIGVAHDPTFGPLIMFGLGGIYVEVLKDVAFRLHPLSDIDAAEMVRSIKSYPLLKGVRGEPPADIEAIKSALMRVSALVGDFHEIQELDINPFMVMAQGEGAYAVDGRILLSE